MLQTPALTRNRVRLAYAAAILADAFQMLFGLFGVTFLDEIIDVIAMVLIWRAVGFHPLLLPTFVVECIPFVDMLPTWTACVAFVVALRRKQQGARPPDRGPVIDV